MIESSLHVFKIVVLSEKIKTSGTLLLIGISLQQSLLHLSTALRPFHKSSSLHDFLHTQDTVWLIFWDVDLLAEPFYTLPQSVADGQWSGLINEIRNHDSQSFALRSEHASFHVSGSPLYCLVVTGIECTLIMKNCYVLSSAIRCDGFNIIRREFAAVGALSVLKTNGNHLPQEPLPVCKHISLMPIEVDALLSVHDGKPQFM